MLRATWREDQHSHEQLPSRPVACSQESERVHSHTGSMYAFARAMLRTVDVGSDVLG